MTLTLGSLCSGIGSLELAVSTVLDTRLLWQSEIDKAASKVLAVRFPEVPNLGDLREVDWGAVPPVDVMCFGFPCQDLSSAGKRAGIEKGSKSGLWYACLHAVRMVRPRYIFVENVAALLANRGGRDFGIVLAGLAEAGYDVRWTCLRASDVGAPHRRDRIFLWCTVTDADGVELQRRGGSGVVDGEKASAEGTASKREWDGDTPLDRGEAAADADSKLPEPPALDSTWGVYAPAITHWERVIGRPAPPPRIPSGQLSSHFVEWMMGHASGWVADLLPRTPAIAVLGASIVPQQAVAALDSLLPLEAAS